MADHFPIITHIDFPVPRSVKNRPWNFKATDWHYFRQVLVDKLETTPITENLNSPEEIEEALSRIKQAVLDTMDLTVPKSNPSPYSKRWWNKDLEKARRTAKNINIQGILSIPASFQP